MQVDSGSEFHQQKLMQVEDREANAAVPQLGTIDPQLAENDDYGCLIVEEPPPDTPDAQTIRSP